MKEHGIYSVCWQYVPPEYRITEWNNLMDYTAVKKHKNQILLLTYSFLH
jgi:hypothetical protein